MPSSGHTTRHRAWRLLVLAAILGFAVPSTSQLPARGLAEATIEELMNITVTTVSKKEQTLSSAPAAVYVITQEDIRPSGVTSLPEALRLAGAAAPLSLCVFGRDPFGDDLGRLALRRTVRSRPLTVTHIERAPAARVCHIVFLSAQEQRRTPIILQAIAGLPILTVGETPEFLNWGGAINFVLERDQVRFEINPQAAESVRLKISSKLLALARVVHVGSGGGE